MTRDYVLDQGFAQERARLSGMESLRDPGSRALLDELGIGKGWKCIEVGAGGGSLVEWMADRGARRHRNRHRHPLHRVAGLRIERGSSRRRAYRRASAS